MTTYENLPTPAGRWAKPCACGTPAALVHDGRVWCIACHVTDLRTPPAPEPERRPSWHHRAPRMRIVAHRPRWAKPGDGEDNR